VCVFVSEEKGSSVLGVSGGWRFVPYGAMNRFVDDLVLKVEEVTDGLSKRNGLLVQLWARYSAVAIGRMYRAVSSSLVIAESK
jgi:hypothetical protein